MSVDNSYLVIDLKKRKSNIFSCRFVMRKMRSLVSFETETKRGKYVIPAAPCCTHRLHQYHVDST